MRLLLFVALLAAGGCPQPHLPPVQTPSGFISCATTAVAQQAPRLVPMVNECLTGSGDATSCLLGLLGPGVTIDILGCLVRHEGDAADRAAVANPNDATDARAAARAKAFITSHGLQFAP